MKNELQKEFLSILYNTPTATDALAELKKRGVEYSDKMFSMIWEHQDRLTGLKSILAVYSVDEASGIQISNRKVLVGSVLLLNIIEKNWVEGMEYVLDRFPNLVNFIIIPFHDISYSRSVLMHVLAYSSPFEWRMLDLVIEKSEFIDLKNYTGNTIFHNFAMISDLCIRHKQQLNRLLEKSTTAMISQKNDDGQTPLDVALDRNNNPFIESVKEYHSEVPEKRVLNTVSSRLVLEDKESAAQIIHSIFASQPPVIKPIIMMLTLLGHQSDHQNAASELRLFFSIDILRLELISILEKGVKEFSMIGNLQLSLNHSVTFLLQLAEDNCLRFRFFETAVGSLHLNLHHFSFLRSIEERFNLTSSLVSTNDLKFRMSSGCRGQSCYYSGNLLSMTPSELTAILSNENPSVASLPLKTGALAVCQSVSTIEKALTQMNLSDDEENEFRTKLKQRCQYEFDPRYVCIENKLRNYSLRYEINNQMEFALKGLQSATYEKLAKLICMPPERSKLLEFIFENSLSWTDLNELSCYEDLLFINKILLNNHNKYLPYFIDSNVDLDHQDPNGFTLLMLAVTFNKVELVRTLLNLGIDPRLKKNNSKNTALDIAFHKRHCDMLALLQNYSNASTGALKRFSPEPPNGPQDPTNDTTSKKMTFSDKRI